MPPKPPTSEPVLDLSQKHPDSLPATVRSSPKPSAILLPKHHDLNQILKSVEANTSTLVSQALNLEKNLQAQIFKYQELKALDTALFEFRSGEGIGLGLVTQSTKDKLKEEDLTVSIIDTRMDIGELQLDYEEIKLNYENAVKIFKDTANLVYSLKYASLAVCMNVNLDYWKNLIESQIKQRNEIYLEYHANHAEIIEKTNVEMMEQRLKMSQISPALGGDFQEKENSSAALNLESKTSEPDQKS